MAMAAAAACASSADFDIDILHVSQVKQYVLFTRIREGRVLLYGRGAQGYNLDLREEFVLIRPMYVLSATT
jgi:hypothetical protein